jgi:hypothetical protein
MRSLYWVSLALTILGSINWGLVGAIDFNLVTHLFGPASSTTLLVYSLVGLSGLYLLVHTIGNASKKH